MVQVVVDRHLLFCSILFFLGEILFTRKKTVFAMGMKASLSSSSSSSFRTRLLHENGKSYGPFLLSGSSTIAELIGHVGYSHIVVDMEHSPTTDIPQLTSMLRAIDAAASARSRRRGQPKTTTTNGGQQVQHQNRPSNFPIVRAPSNNDVCRPVLFSR